MNLIQQRRELARQEAVALRYLAKGTGPWARHTAPTNWQEPDHAGTARREQERLKKARYRAKKAAAA